MKLADGADIYGYSIFCDDIRHEVNGKLTYVGAYQDKMWVHAGFPAMLPKFGIATTLIQKHSIFVPPSKVLVFFPGDPEDQASVEMDAPHIEGTPGGSPDLPSPDNPHAIVRAVTILNLGPLVIRQPGHITVRMLRNDELIRCGTLKIETAPESAPPPV